MNLQSRTVLGSPPRSAQEAQATLDSLVMTWAHDVITGQAVYVMELGADRNGSKCGCECPSCGHPLTAANAGKAEGTYIQKPHFKHRTGVVKDSCLVLVARAAALRLLVEDGMIDLPSRTRCASWVGLSGAAYRGASEVAAQQRRVSSFYFRDHTSAILSLDDGKQVIVQLTGTNIMTATASEDATAGRATVFIDIDDPRLAGMSPDELRTRLRLLPAALCWHTHWDDVALEQEAIASAKLSAQELFDWPDDINAQALASVPPELRRETLLHYIVKQILATTGRVRVPSLTIQESAGSGSTTATADAVLIKEQYLALENPRLEHRLGKLIPDVCADAVNADGTSLGLLCIEVTVTNGFDPERLIRAKQANHLMLEIDLSKRYGRISRSELVTLVVDELAGKRWLHHPECTRIQNELRATAMAASKAKEKEKEEVLRRERERTPLHTSFEPTIERQPVFVYRPDLPSPEDDRARCHLKLQNRKSGWMPSEALLDGLISLRHGIGIGHHKGLSARLVAHKLRCSIDTHLHCLVLIALKAFCTGPIESDQTVFDEWSTNTRKRLRENDPMWNPPPGALQLLKELFPELTTAVDKMNAFLRKQHPGPRWTTGELSVSGLKKAETLRKTLYNDGAYRHYAPRIDYERVMAEAQSARVRQEGISALLDQWSMEYALGDNLKPITDVLRIAGLIN